MAEPDHSEAAPPAAETAAPAYPAGDGHTPYRVNLDLFEGPLDLLLHLIKRNEVDVRELPVARITEQYLGYLELMRELNLDIAGEYLVMAATLTLLKSRMLLPSPPTEQDEETDLRDDLVRQLLEYQRYREAAESLAARPRLHRDTFARQPSAAGVAPDRDAQPLIAVTLWDLLEALRAVMRRTKPDPVHQVASEAVSLRERVAALLQTLSASRTVTFDSLFGEEPSRGYVIVTFLAVLELVKQHVVQAVQEAILGPILIVAAVDDIAGVTIDLFEEYEGSAAAPPDAPSAE
ncbi:MAG: ScpA family protein [Candidatus Binatia bacterium]